MTRRSFFAALAAVIAWRPLPAPLMRDSETGGAIRFVRSFDPALYYPNRFDALLGWPANTFLKGDVLHFDDVRFVVTGDVTATGAEAEETRES